MQEDFLHYIWKYKAFDSANLKTTNGQPIVIKNLGQHNFNSGPDFFNSQLIIAEQLWAGNVEIHLKSSDWYVHNHERDKAYDNVILHVVWEHDSDIFRKDNTLIPTLELKPYVDVSLLYNYKSLIKSKSWINCEKDFGDVDDFTLNNWLERLYFERLQRKSNSINELLRQSQNNWESVLFKLLLKNFGLNVNSEAMLSLGKSIDYSIIRKVRNNCQDFEALLFGQAGLLEVDSEELYVANLKERYTFLKHKYQLTNQGVIPLQFFRLRPPNFPTIRLSQVVNLYNIEDNLFSKIISLQKKDDFYCLFKVGVTDYWKSHYTFSKESTSSNKLLTKSFIDLLIINTIIPIKFAYANSQGKFIEEELLSIIKSLNVEKNSVVDKFFKLRTFDHNACNSQSLLQLKQEYCDKNKCLQCAIGNNLITKN
ncbi:DUF2851 family protein [Winogradskyella vincentii]|uniref:DUF2851 family protein n=1 Tax=Winogradskyella vincentii TaxID=2877122 RepID=A0ABS7XYQ4_9FLAO|nr:DUF2851 family protein [Winogradskyella vincentii]MCA0151603.1 DUF2851 family protein [Winogradskyella vincentii]